MLHFRNCIYVPQVNIASAPLLFIHKRLFKSELVRDISLLYPGYRIEGTSWNIVGDFTRHTYTVYDNSAPTAYIHKKWFTLGIVHTLEIDDEYDETPIIAIILAIDYVLSINKVLVLFFLIFVLIIF